MVIRQVKAVRVDPVFLPASFPASRNLAFLNNSIKAVGDLFSGSIQVMESAMRNVAALSKEHEEAQLANRKKIAILAQKRIG